MLLVATISMAFIKHCRWRFCISSSHTTNPTVEKIVVSERINFIIISQRNKKRPAHCCATSRGRYREILELKIKREKIKVDDREKKQKRYQIHRIETINKSNGYIAKEQSYIPQYGKKSIVCHLIVDGIRFHKTYMLMLWPLWNQMYGVTLTWSRHNFYVSQIVILVTTNM